jgi:hypothetical protein
MKKSLFALAICLVLSTSFAQRAHAGNEGPHGGDTYALEFTAIGIELADQLSALEQKDNHLFKQWNFTADEFRQVVQGSKEIKPVRVVSQERVYLVNQEVEAINDSSKLLITVSRSAWRESQLHERVRLVLHEYFGILGVERDRYDASLDFSNLALSVTRAISQKAGKDGYMANLFYGYAQSYPALSESQTCAQSSKRIQDAIATAAAQAQSRCEMSQNSSCKVIGTTLSEIVSTRIIGMKYCEVLVLMK